MNVIFAMAVNALVLVFAKGRIGVTAFAGNCGV